MLSATSIILALVGGILPALFWLWFWLREDRLNPEPQLRIALCFVAGMIAVLFVFPLQKYTFAFFSVLPAFTFILWALVEEVAKYLSAHFSALRSKDCDEPIDAMIYMVTAALGFSALENTFFIFGPLVDGDFMQSLSTGNMRFIGASVLHVASSAIIGFFISETFYSKKWKKMVALLCGIILAITLHALFNLFIIISDGTWTLFAFGLVWLIALMIIFLFDKERRPSRVQKTPTQ